MTLEELNAKYGKPNVASSKPSPFTFTTKLPEEKNTFGSRLNTEQIAGAKKVQSSVKKGAEDITIGKQQLDNGNLFGFLNTAKGVAEGAFGTITGATRSALAPVTAAIEPVAGFVQKRIPYTVDFLKRDHPIIAKAIETASPEVQHQLEPVVNKTKELLEKHPDATTLAGDILNTVLLGIGGGSTKLENIFTKQGLKSDIAAVSQIPSDISKGYKAGIESLQPKAIDSLEQTYENIMSGTTAGKKKLARIETKTENLNRAGTEGKTPARTLAEEGIIPNRKGTKIDTFDQAQEYKKTIEPLRDANRQALKETGLSTQPLTIDALEADALAYAKTPKNVNSGRYAKMEKDIRKEWDILRQEYPDGIIPLELADDIKVARWENVFKNKGLIEADALTRDSEYAIAKAIQKRIEETAKVAGNPEVAQLNRTIGDKLEAAKFLEDINGKTIKGGRLLKYVTTAMGSAAGKTIPGKIIGALGGNLVGEMIISNNVASPVKRLILKNLEKTNPEAYTKTLEWLKTQQLDRETRLLLPAGKETGIPLGPTADKSSVKMIPAEKNPTTMNPKTGKFQKSYSSQEKSPTTTQTTRAINKDKTMPKSSTTTPKKSSPKGKGTIPENSLISEAKKYKSAEEFVNKADITKTPEFKKWAGNNKVVEVYHGSPNEFDSFKVGNDVYNVSGQPTSGISFADDVKNAEPFSRQYSEKYNTEYKQISDKFKKLYDEAKTKTSLPQNDVKNIASKLNTNKQTINSDEAQAVLKWAGKRELRTKLTDKELLQLEEIAYGNKSNLDKLQIQRAKAIKELDKKYANEGKVYRAYLKGKVVEVNGEDIGFGASRNELVDNLAPNEILKINNADTGQYIGTEYMTNNPGNIFVVNTGKTKSQLEEIWKKANNKK